MPSTDSVRRTSRRVGAAARRDPPPCPGRSGNAVCDGRGPVCARRSARAAYAHDVARRLAGRAPDEWPGLLLEALDGAPGGGAWAAAAVLDADGRQLTPTVRALAGARHDRRERTVLFPPPAPGDDHALKEYVFLLGTDPGAVYESAPYVPLPNERLCVTVSTAFADPSGARRLVCLHLAADPTAPPDLSPPTDDGVG